MNNSELLPSMIKGELSIILNYLYYVIYGGLGDWGLGIGDWGLGPIPNPQSPIPNPHFLSLI
jgi:hypothetical protein